MNAEVFLPRCRQVMSIYVMLIEKNRTVERFVVIIAYDAQLHTAAKTSLF